MLVGHSPQYVQQQILCLQYKTNQIKLMQYKADAISVQTLHHTICFATLQNSKATHADTSETDTESWATFEGWRCILHDHLSEKVWQLCLCQLTGVSNMPDDVYTVLDLQNIEQISLAVEEPWDIKLESTAILDSIAAAKPEHAACPSTWAVRIGCSPALNSFCMSNPRSGKWPATRHCNRWHSSAVSLCTVSAGMHCKLVRDRAQSRLMQALTAICSMLCQSLGFGVGQSACWCAACA